MSVKYIWYISCSSPHIYLAGRAYFLGKYLRDSLDGYALTDLSDFLSSTDEYLNRVLNTICENLHSEIFAVFNYNHFGPVVLILSPSRERRILTGYGNWGFSHYHYRHFLGQGFFDIHPRYKTPSMFYPYVRGSFEVEEVILLCMLEFSNQYQISKAVSRQIVKMINVFERGYRFTITGRKPFGMEDLFSRILHLIQTRYGKYVMEDLVRVFVEHRIYYQPTVICEEFRHTFDLIRQFIYILNAHPGENLEKYLLGAGFEKPYFPQK